VANLFNSYVVHSVSDYDSADVRPAGVALFVGLLAIIAGAIVLANMFVLDRMVVGSGTLATTVPATSIRPLQTTQVEDVLVRPGQWVRRGQLLVRFKRAMDVDALHALEEKGSLLAAEISRLRLEIDAGPGGIATLTTMVDPQSRLLSDRQDLRESKRLRIVAEVRGEIAQQGAQSSVIRADRQTLALETSRLSALQRLFDEGYYPRQMLFQQQEVVLLHHATLERDQSSYVQSAERVAALTAQRDALNFEDHANAITDFVDRTKQLQDVRRDIVRQRDLLALTNERAPFDAYILEVAPQNGTTIASAAPIVTLIPASSPLQAEVYIANQDVSYVRPGTSVRVKIDAFPFERHGYVEGRVIAVVREATDSRSERSADTGHDRASAESATRFRVIVSLGRRLLHDLPHSELLPGMSVEADMRVGTRTVASYFLDPILHHAANALTEPG